MTCDWRTSALTLSTLGLKALCVIGTLGVTSHCDTEKKAGPLHREQRGQCGGKPQTKTNKTCVTFNMKLYFC